MLPKKRIIVVYDTSFLVGKGRSVKQFIMAQRISSRPRPGPVGSLLAKLTGKERDQKAYHPPDNLFVVVEVIPSEVIAEVEKHPDKEGGLKLITELLADQADEFALIADTIAGRVVSGRPSEPEIDPNDVDEMLVRYAGRLGAPQTKEHYDLVLVATGDNTITKSLAEVNNVYIVGPEDLKAPSGLRGRLAEVVNAGRPDKLTIEDGANERRRE
jgi:hypothetical protein